MNTTTMLAAEASAGGQTYLIPVGLIFFVLVVLPFRAIRNEWRYRRSLTRGF